MEPLSGKILNSNFIEGHKKSCLRLGGTQLFKSGQITDPWKKLNYNIRFLSKAFQPKPQNFV